MARRRGLSDEDRELWSRVARSATPLKKDRPLGNDSAASRSGVDEFDPVSQLPRPSAPAKAPRAGMVLKPHRAGGGGSSGHDLAPSPAEHLAAQPLRMDPKTHRKMSRGKLRPEARIDLHGMTLAQAHPALIGFVLTAQSRGYRLVLVITGKGRGDPEHGPLPTRPGVLRHQVPHWLHSGPLAGVVMQVVPAHLRHGGAGAYYVYLRRTRG